MLEALLNTVRQAYPELIIEDAYLNEDGQYNHVVIVNDDMVFRFARFEESVKTLQKEIAILQSVQNHITLEVPNPIYQQLAASATDQCFVGYPKIHGIPLWHDVFQKITDKSVLNGMAEQLANFLKELHSIPIAKVVPDMLVNGDGRPYWMDLYNRFQSKLFPHMSKAGQDRVVAHFMNFLDNPERFAYAPVLRHGDFGGGNIIFDQETCAIAGIIDFGFADLGDPAIDVGGLFGFGESFVERCIPTYPEIAEMLERVHFYSGTFALQEALFGVEHDVPDAFENGIADYR